MSRPAVLPALALALLTVLPAASALVVGPLDAAATPVPDALPSAPTSPEAVPKTEAEVLAQAARDGIVLENGKVQQEAGLMAGPGVLAPCPASSAPTELTPGVGVQGTDPSTGTADDCHYIVSTDGLDLTGKRLRVTITGTTSDHDPYVKFATPATVSPYACSSASGNATFDECSVDPPLSVGDYYIRISRFSSTASDFTVTAYVEDLPVCPLGFGPNLLLPGTNVTTTLPGVTGGRCYFTFTSDSNLVRVNMTPSASTDNYNLYVRRDLLPTSVSPNFDCSSLLSGTSTDTCSAINNGTTFYVMVLRSTGTNGNATFNIRFDELGGCSLGNGVIALTHDVNVTASLSPDVNANCQFSLDTGASADLAKGFVFPTGVNVDLAVRKGLRATNSATTGHFDCRAVSTGITTTDTCSAGLGPGTYYLVAWRPSATGGTATFNAKAQAIQTCSLGAGTTTLLNNVPQAADLANEVGAACNFVFTPPATEDSLRVSMSPPPAGGDFDLYLKKGAPPTTSVYDCRPFLSGNATETCTGANDGSPWYALVRRFSGSGTFTITATGFSPCSLGNGDTALAAGVAQLGSLTTDVGAACFFAFAPDLLVGDLAQVDLDVPAGSDFDLYLKKGSRPTTSTFDCKASTLGDGSETCAVEADASTVFAMVHRVAGSGEFGVVATNVASCSLGLGDHTLGEAVARAADLLAFAGAKCFFVYGADDARGDSMRFTMAPPGGSNFDLYVKRGARPSTTSYDCRPLLGVGIGETCELEVLADGPVHVMVRSSSGGGSFSVTGSAYDTCSLGPGIHALADGARTAGALTANAWAKCWYVFQPAANADFVNYRMELTTSDFDLYVRKGALPTASLWDCRPFTGGTTAEECNALLEDASAYYGMVKRFSGSGAFNVTASNIILPQLSLGVPLPGNVGTGQFQYWKVVLPPEAAHLSVAVVGDPLGVACGLAAPAAVVCNPHPLITEVACTGTDPAVCGAKNQTYAAVCPQAPQACAAQDTTDADLFVRHIADLRTPRGLPTTSLYSCRSATPGSLETCTFNTALNETLTQAGLAARLPANVPILPLPGTGKYFIGVRGADGPAKYLITAVWAPPALPGLPAPPV